MKAAVVHGFDRPLRSRTCRSRARARAGARPHRGLRPLPHRHPRRARRVAGQAVAAVHPRPRGRRHRRARRAGQPRTASSRGDAGRAAVARLRLRRLPLLQLRAARRCARQQLNMGYGMDGGFAEYAVGYARHVVRVPDGVDPRRCRPADLRRRHDLQGGQGLRRRLRRASSRSSAPAASATSRSSTRASPGRRSSPSISTGSGSRRPPSSAPSTSSTPARRTPSRRSSASAAPTWRSPPPPRPSAFEQAFALARPRRRARLRRPARRQRHAVPIFETVLGGLTIRDPSSGPSTTSRRSSSSTAAA